MFSINLPLRILQALLAVSTLGLSGYTTNWYLHHTHPTSVPASTTYLLTTSLLTLLALPYLTLNPALSLSHSGKPPGHYFNKYAVLGLDLFLCALWFAGFVALAVFEHGLHICAGHVCRVMIGTVVVSVLEMVGFAGAAGLAVVHVLRTRGGESMGHERWVGQMEARKV